MDSFITGLIVAFVAFVTFPGIVVQLARQLLCYYFGIPVFKVCYFQPWPPGGWVVYDPPSSPWTGIMLIIGPAFANTILGLVIGFPAVFGLLTSDGTIITSCLDLFLIWLGVSIAVHTFPTFKDAELTKNTVAAARHPAWVQSTGAFIAALIYVGAICKIIWFDVIYALIVVVGMPILLFEILRSAT